MLECEDGHHQEQDPQHRHVRPFKELVLVDEDKVANARGVQASMTSSPLGRDS
jgi:hypothetical protein